MIQSAILPSLLSRTFCRLWLLMPRCIRLFTYHRLIQIGIRLYGWTSSSRAFRLPFGLYAKYGENVLKSQANVMRFLAEKTTIPIPHVIDCIPVPTGVFIVMTRLPGDILMDKLVHMTADERAQFAQDLGASLKQLRALTSPDSRICSIDGGPFRDYRIHEIGQEGPFNSEKEFYEHLYSRIPPEHHPRLRKIAREVHETSHRLCLTHNDLNCHNILVDNNRFSGIVDWECTAWLPEWWEYTRSMYLGSLYPEWIEAMNRAHPQTYPKELEVEKEFWRVNVPW